MITCTWPLADARVGEIRWRAPSLAVLTAPLLAALLAPFAAGCAENAGLPAQIPAVRASMATATANSRKVVRAELILLSLSFLMRGQLYALNCCVGAASGRAGRPVPEEMCGGLFLLSW